MKFITLVLLWTSTSLALSVDPYVHWRSLRTPHFEIIYDRNQRELADQYGVAAEQAHDILKTRFSELPAKTFIILMDNTDETNGGATFLPYPAIVIYPVLPDSLMTLDYFGNWPLGLILHEYTHILEFQPAHGVYTPLKYIFGSIVRPNGLLPRWYLEGLAVESESRYTPFGRLKSPHAFAEYRALVQDGKLRGETIDRIDETLLPTFPYGDRPYLFGAPLIEYVVEHGQKSIVEDLNQDYGRRFPWLIEAPIHQYFTANWQHLLTFTYDEIEKAAKQQIATIEARHKEEFHPFVEADMEQFSPAISPDGRSLIFFTSSLMRGQIRLIEREGAASFSTLKSKKIYDLEGAVRLSWLPDSRSFIFDQIDETAHYHTYRELYRFDVKTQDVQRLTKELRAQEPAVSPDGKTVAFVANSGANQWLGVLDLQSLHTKKLFGAPIFERLSQPEFVSEHEIAYTHRTMKGEEHLEVYDLASGKTQMYFPRSVELRRPKNTPIGLLVADTDSGVENIFIADLIHQTLKPITNTATEIQTAEWDPVAKELIATRMTGQGRKLVVMQTTTETPPRIGSVIKADWPTPPVPANIPQSEFVDESYQPVGYLWPRYWVPFAYPVYNGVYVSGSTSMADPAGINTYTASVAYDTVTQHGQFGLQYVNASLPPDIQTQYIKSENYLSASGDILQEQTAMASLAFYLPWLSPHWSASGGYMWDQMDTPWNNRFLRVGPLASLSYSNWNDPRAEGAGTIVSLMQEQFLPTGGTDSVSYGRSVAAVTQAWKAGLPKDHRIVLTARAAVSPDMPFQDVVALGDGSLGANYLVSLSNSQFLFRGFPTGEFVGRKLVNWNLEYQLPLSKNGWGLDTAPIFSRSWDMAVFFDGLGVDGAYYDPTDTLYHSRSLGDVAMSTGVEARWNTTAFYGYPITWIFGMYFGFDDLARNQVMPYIGIAGSDISAIDQLRKNWFKRW